MRKRFSLLILVFAMIITFFPVPSASANGSNGIMVYSEGNPVEGVDLDESERVTLTGISMATGSAKYQWQILVSDNVWVDIKGEEDVHLELSYAKVASVLENNQAKIRVKVTTDESELFSSEVKVKINEDGSQDTILGILAQGLRALGSLLFSPITANDVVTMETEETPVVDSVPEVTDQPIVETSEEETPVEDSLPETTEQPIVELSEEETLVDKGSGELVEKPSAQNQVVALNEPQALETYNIIINYVFQNGVQAATSWTATVSAGSNYAGNITSPSVVGYTPDSATVAINYTNITQDKIITVTYVPALVNYTVKHYRQNITDDLYSNYLEETKQGYTESAVGNALAKSYPGFFSLRYDETVKISADGSTVVEVYYDRYYYLMNFNLNGGYGVEPIYARFGSSITVGTPTRAGYTFNGWNPTVPSTVPSSNATYTAQWTANTSVGYTLVYWVENANDTNYSYHSQASKTGGVAGQAVPALDPADRKAITYFTYKEYDNTKIIAGDGSTIVNVYYSRNSYTVRFDLNRNNATLTIGGTTYTDSDRSSNWYSFTAKYDSDISAKWPTATNIPNVVGWFGRWNFFGWSGNSNTYVSKRLNFTDDLFNTNGTIRDFSGSWLYNTTTYDLNYMFESLTGSGERQYNNKWYIEDQSYSQIANSSGNWRAKAISGMTDVAVTTDNQPNGDGDYDVYFYYTYNSYNLSFYNLNATVPNTGGSVKYTAPLSSYNFTPSYPTNLEPGAYQFVGWYTTPTTVSGTEVNWSTMKMPASNMTFYAKWVPVTRTVKTFLTEGAIGGTPLNTWTVTHGTSIPNPPADPTNGGYTFVGWFYKEGNAEKAFDFSMPVRKDLNLYAKWSSNVLVNYTIRFQLEDDTPVASPITGSSLAGNTKTFDAKGGVDLFAAYQTGYFPTTNSHSITLDITDLSKNEYTFVYVPRTSVPYKVRYLEVETNNVLYPEKSTTTTSALVTENFQTITGYMPDAYQKRLVVSLDESQNVITFWYVKDTTHAPVQVVHYVQNIVGDGYTTHQTFTNLNGIIGQSYSEGLLSIAGFEYASSKVNGVVTPLIGNQLTGTIQTSGLLLEIYYNRKLYPYEFRYILQGTTTVLADPLTGTARYQTQVTQNPKVIPGYVASPNTPQAITIQIENGTSAVNNLKTFYYQEQQVLINYVAVGPQGATNFGTLNRTSENLPVVSGTALGSTPTAKPGYRFVGWYKDPELTVVATTATTLIPQKTKDYDDSSVVLIGYEAATYYAKFEYDRTSLTVHKTGAEAIDENQSFIFTIKGDSTATLGIELRVVINISSEQTQGSKTIQDLPVGHYTVTEDNGWSWRYTPDSVVKGIDLHPTNTNTVAFLNTRTSLKWLNGASYKYNKFNSVGN